MIIRQTHWLSLLGLTRFESTFPFSGQGAAQAIEDVAVLKTLFAEVTGVSQLEKAFEAFDFARRERSQRIAQSSRDFGRIYLFRQEDVGDDPQKIRQFSANKHGDEGSLESHRKVGVLAYVRGACALVLEQLRSH